ncbi:MAG: hypothetical protein QOE97_2991, partial [Pseudonocardiales bacterium]|nr:hypothetical protein [Pseudonocardiales bacterium]
MERFSRAGLTFDVHDSGPRDGPVVVLLHGFPQFNDSWDAVAARLTAAGLRCVAPNQRGYSPGARPEGRRAYRMSELVEDIDALIDATGAGRVHLVAHDWGAAAAWQYAAAHPERLASFNPLAVPHGAAFLRALVSSRQFFRSYYMYLFQLPAVPERLLVGGDGTQWRRLSTLLQTTHQSKERADRDAKAMADSGALHYAINWYRGIPLS